MDIYSPEIIRRTLQPLGFHFSKARGQNFLIDPEVPRRIAAEVPPGSGVLEIGPGFGALTQMLLPVSERLVAVEIDRRLAAVLSARYAGERHFTLLEADILRTDLSVVAAEHFAGLTPVAAANLPYAITSDTLQVLIEARPFALLLLMVQREVAQRLTAPPGGRDYGAFTIYVRAYCRTEILFTVPPEVFLPRPAVTSAVIRLTRREIPLVPPEKTKLFFTLTRAAFAQRRKTLLNALSAALADRMDKPALEAALRRAGIDPAARGETLDIADYLRLCDALS